MSQTDEDLIAEYQLGNVEAFEDLFQRYKGPILNFALRVLSNRADAEDVTAEVFFKLYTKKHMYQPVAKFKTWIFSIAHNACMTVFRKQKRLIPMWFRKDGEGGYESWDVPDDQDSPVEELKKKEQQKMVRKAIQQLSKDQREALILREYHQMNYAQIAEVMSCTVDNVKVLIYRARTCLRDRLAL